MGPGRPGPPLTACWRRVGSWRWRRSRRLAALRRDEWDPYVVGAVVQDPKKFYGREEALQSILTALAHGNHVAVYGERRIGKTSLLYQVAHRLRAEPPSDRRFIPVIVNLQMVTEDQFFQALMSHVARAARPLVSDLELSCDKRPRDYGALDMVEDLETLFDALGEAAGSERPTRIMLLLDEGDEINSYAPSTQGPLRGLFMTPVGQQVRLVWSGQHLDRTWKLNTSPWYNLFKEPVYLAGLSEEAATRLIREPVQGL